VAISKAKTLKDAFEYAKTSVSTYFYFLRRKFEIKEEIAQSKATAQSNEQRHSALGWNTANRNEGLRKAYEDERIKNNKLNEKLEIQRDQES
jgi:hypothetical protein